LGIGGAFRGVFEGRATVSKVKPKNVWKTQKRSLGNDRGTVSERGAGELGVLKNIFVIKLPRVALQREGPQRVIHGGSNNPTTKVVS